MNKFDEFINETDKKLNLDTSTRTTTVYSNKDTTRSPEKAYQPTSPSSPIINNASKFNLQRQITPTRIKDHPLKNNGIPKSSNQGTVPITTPPFTMTNDIIPKKRNTLPNRRRSLIQPVIAPTSPDTFLNKPRIPDDNVLKKSNIISKRKYSTGISGIVVDPEYTQLSVHSRNSSLASNSSNLDSNDIHALLKNLANKELELFESKRNIEDLKKQLTVHEKVYLEKAHELQLLKTQVSKHLSENVNNTSNITSSPNNLPLDIPMIETENIISTTSSPRIKETKGLIHRTNSIQKNNNIPVENKETSVSPVRSISSEPVKKSVGSVWSKPLAIFNQFDQILQNELEKSLNWDSGADNDSPEKINKNSGPKIFNPGTPEIENQTATFLRNNNKESVENSSVSRSLWSFVDSVKTGLLGIDEEDEGETQNKLGLTGDNASISTTSNDTMKQFKTTQKIQSNKLSFIDGAVDNDTDAVRKNIEMKEF